MKTKGGEIVKKKNIQIRILHVGGLLISVTTRMTGEFISYTNIHHCSFEMKNVSTSK